MYGRFILFAATPGTNRSKSKVSGLKPAKSMPSIARTVSTPPSVPKSSSNVSGLSSVAGRRPSWVSPGKCHFILLLKILQWQSNTKEFTQMIPYISK